jgi:hypothetical protein
MTDATPPAPQPPHPAETYRDEDINLRAVLGFGVALAGLVVVSLGGLAWWFAVLHHRADRETVSRFPLSAEERGELPQTAFGSPATGQLPASPRLEGLEPAARHETGSAAARYAEDEDTLMSYGKPGAARIPIGVAMWLVVEERKPQGREPAPLRFGDAIHGGGSNSGRDLPEARR